MSHQDVYQKITDRIVEQLEQGVVAWRKPWIVGKSMNLNSGKAYRGINTLILATSPFSSPYWVTFKQAKECGGSVRKGERGYPIVFWNVLEKENDEGEVTSRFGYLRQWTVFNVEQCDGVDYPAAITRDFQPVEAAERVVAAMPHKPGIVHLGGDRAYYEPERDRISLPKRELFNPAEAYYCTLFHELGHSTGYVSRLARPEVMNPGRFGSERYSREELVAEITAAMLCGITGIAPATIENSAAYVGSWLQALKNDKRMVITAAGLAQHAADFILNEWSDAQADAQAGTSVSACCLRGNVDDS